MPGTHRSSRCGSGASCPGLQSVSAERRWSWMDGCYCFRFFYIFSWDMFQSLVYCCMFVSTALPQQSPTYFQPGELTRFVSRWVETYSNVCPAMCQASYYDKCNDVRSRIRTQSLHEYSWFVWSCICRQVSFLQPDISSRHEVPHSHMSLKAHVYFYIALIGKFTRECIVHHLRQCPIQGLPLLLYTL